MANLWAEKAINQTTQGLQQSTKHWCSPDLEVSNKQFRLTRFSRNNSPTFANSLTFPDFPDMWESYASEYRAGYQNSPTAEMHLVLTSYVLTYRESLVETQTN